MKTETMSFDIHYSGSKGNCASIYYDNLGFLIDIGKPYKYIEPYLFNKQFILITHKHQDHLVYTTYKKIKENFPHIKVLGNQEVQDNLKKRSLPQLDLIFKDDFQFQIGEVKFTTLQNYHGAGEEYAETHGFIMETPNQNTLFATDLSTMTDYEKYLLENDLKIDTLLLEANYDPKVIEFYESTKQHTGYSIFSSGSYRHLSIIDREVFVNKFAKQGAINVELHQSETYRTFEGLIKRSKGNITKEAVARWKQRHG